MSSSKVTYQTTHPSTGQPVTFSKGGRPIRWITWGDFGEGFVHFGYSSQETYDKAVKAPRSTNPYAKRYEATPAKPVVNLVTSAATELVANAALLGENGGTVSVGRLSLPETGYYVGGVVPTLVFGSRGEVRFPEVLSFLETSGTSYVGFWVDSEDGRVHFDAVDWYESGTLAEAVGASRGEIAIWDVRNDCEIRLNTAGSEQHA